MKISVNDQELYTLSEIQCQVICNDIHQDIFEEDMKRRLEYILMHKYERCMARLKAEWMPKLVGRVESVPLDNDAFAMLVFAQPDYKDREERDALSEEQDV